METYFDASKRHFITVAGKNQYPTPLLHPNRKLQEHDFIYMIEGVWKIGEEGYEYEIKTGDVLILGANRSHYGVAPCSAGTKTIFIHALGIESDCFDKENNGVFPLPSHIKAQSNSNVQRCFEKVVYAKSCEENIMASIYFDALLYELRETAQAHKENMIAEQIRELLIFSDEMLTNSQIADRLHISVKSAEKHFKQAFNKSIHQYMLERKIDLAKYYLSNFPSLRIFEIAEMLGFYDQFHFSKQFKSFLGVSPLAYRKMIN